MAEQSVDHSSFTVPASQPLIGVFVREDDRDAVRYFADEEAADAALAPDTADDALRLAGVWSDLEWTEVEKELDRIRHESPPSPPISV